jgi:hypothetical protein
MPSKPTVKSRGVSKRRALTEQLATVKGMENIAYANWRVVASFLIRSPRGKLCVGDGAIFAKLCQGNDS